MSKFRTAEVKTRPNPDWFTQKGPDPDLIGGTALVLLIVPTCRVFGGDGVVGVHSRVIYLFFGFFCKNVTIS